MDQNRPDGPERIRTDQNGPELTRQEQKWPNQTRPLDQPKRKFSQSKIWHCVLKKCSDHVHNIMLFLLGLTFWLHFASCQYNVYRQDPFAILSRTLLTYQQAACDGQVLDLVCPSGTKISIQLVQYGRTAPSSQVRRKIYQYTYYETRLAWPLLDLIFTLSNGL